MQALQEAAAGAADASACCVQVLDLFALLAADMLYLRPSATSVCGLKLLVYEALSY